MKEQQSKSTMPKIQLQFFNKKLIRLSSTNQLVIYLIDSTIKFLILLLITFLPFADSFYNYQIKEISRFLTVYIFALFLWGLFMLKLLLEGKNTFGKAKFDIFFMIFLIFSLISSLLSNDKVFYLLGKANTWSFSVLAVLAFSIIYYIGTVMFRYAKGVKFIGFSLVVSSFLVSFLKIVEILYRVLSKNSAILNSDEKISYVAMLFPVVIAFFVIFRSKFLKIFSALTAFFQLIVMSFYFSKISGSVLLLDIGILFLFLVLYFSFWIKNLKTILNSISSIIKMLIKGKITLIFRTNFKGLIMLFTILIMALWIICFGYLSFSNFHNGVGLYVGDVFSNKIKSIYSFKQVMFGSGVSFLPTLSEALNFFYCYGLISFGIIVLMQLVNIIFIVRYIIKLLYVSSIRNVILLCSLLMSFVSIFVQFFLFRFDSLTLVMFSSLLIISSIFDDLINGRNHYVLGKAIMPKSLKFKIIKYLAVIGLTVIIFAGCYFLLSKVAPKVLYRF